MIAALLLALAASPCSDVFDRTSACAGLLHDDTTAIAPDAKVAQVPVDLDTMPAGLGLLSAGAALGGGAGLALALTTTATSEGERVLRDMALHAGAGLLACSALAGAGAVALWLFDPSSGELRHGLFLEQE